jgi:hypothetical protein
MYRLEGFIRTRYSLLSSTVRGIEAAELGVKGTKGLN